LWDGLVWAWYPTPDGVVVISGEQNHVTVMRHIRGRQPEIPEVAAVPEMTELEELREANARLRGERDVARAGLHDAWCNGSYAAATGSADDGYGNDAVSSCVLRERFYDSALGIPYPVPTSLPPVQTNQIDQIDDFATTERLVPRLRAVGKS